MNPHLALGLLVGLVVGLAAAYRLDDLIASRLDQYATLQLWLIEDMLRGR